MTKAALLTTSGSLVLRVCGTERDGQEVRLQSAKCTIGSDASCTLRLQADTVQPVHCLVLRGPNQTIVRRWASDTRLNGRTFDESALKAGDRLSVGPIDLEVVDTGSPSDAPDGVAQQHDSLDDQLVAIEFGLKSLDEPRATSGSGTTARAELDEAEQLKAELASLRSQLEETRRQSEKIQNEWNVRRAAESEQPAARPTALAAEQKALDSARREFEQQKAAWESQKTKAQNELNDRIAGLDALQVDVQTQQTILEKWRQDSLVQGKEPAAEQSGEPDQHAFGSPRPVLIESQEASDINAAVQPELTESTSPADSDGAAAPGEQTQGPTEFLSPNPTRAANSASPAKISSPVNLTEILRRTGFQIEETEAVAPAGNDSAQPSREAATNITSPVPRVRKKVEKHEEEVSIDDYMSSLLARSRGDAPLAKPGATASSGARGPADKATLAAAQSAAPKAPPRNEAALSASSGRTGTASPAPAAKPQTAATNEPFELLRGTAERNIDLRAMRQLANLTANTAINKHETKRLSGTKRTKLAVTILAMIIALALLGFYYLGHAPKFSLALAVASFGVASLWGMSYLSLYKRMLGEQMAHMERHLKGTDEPSTAATPAAGADEASETTENEISQISQINL